MFRIIKSIHNTTLEPSDSVKTRSRMTNEEITSEIRNFAGEKSHDYIIAFPEYQEGWEGFFYEDVKDELRHIYYNPTDEIDVAVYGDTEHFIEDVLYLNSMTKPTRNYPISFHFYQGSLEDFKIRIELIIEAKRSRNDFGKGGTLPTHPDYFNVDTLFALS